MDPPRRQSIAARREVTALSPPFSTYFYGEGRKETCAPPVSLLTGRNSQQFGHQPHESKGTSSLAELFPRFVTPEKKFVEAMSMDGRAVLHAELRHAPASPFFLICGAGVESSKGSANTLEDEFKFLDWYTTLNPVWC
ncbi:hypothetical protein C2S52_012478 [Perilla frutescens var. hirtella]|nr:hypothetical protein C2S52_012478 [Perilla frutescens var. hirtella]